MRASPTRFFVRLVLLSCLGTGLLAQDATRIGSRREPFLDRLLVARIVGDARLEIVDPVDEGVALAFDEPWEGRFSGYATVLVDDPKLAAEDGRGVYRLYYRGRPDAGADGADSEVTCYAESDDGIAWRKPHLELHEVHGTRANNVVLAAAAPATHNFSPFIDRRPGVPRAERFKALGGISTSGLLAFVSGNGVNWRRLGDEPVFRPEGWVLDSQNVAFWSEHEQSYVLYYRRVTDGIRSVARAISPDFRVWTDRGPMRYSDTGGERPSEHLYTSQTQPYFRAPHIYIATAARFLPGRQVLTDEEAIAIDVHPKYFRDTSDAVLMSSRGGQTFDRTFLEALVRPGIGPENWVSRTGYPALNVVPSSATRMSLYVNERYGQPLAHLRRYSFRLDGLTRVRAGRAGGELVTHPLVFDGERLRINFSTSAAGGVRVEIADAEGQPISGYSLAESVETIGNEIEKEVSWRGGRSVSPLRGKTVTLRFVLKDADLFAFRFDSATPSDATSR